MRASSSPTTPARPPSTRSGRSFLALSGASALRLLHLGLLMHRPTRTAPSQAGNRAAQRPALPGKLIDKVKGVGRTEPDERAPGAQGGRAPVRCRTAAQHDVILGMLLDEAASGRLTPPCSSPRPSRTGAVWAASTPFASASACWPQGLREVPARPLGFGFPSPGRGSATSAWKACSSAQPSRRSIRPPARSPRPPVRSCPATSNAPSPGSAFRSKTPLSGSTRTGPKTT